LTWPMWTFPKMSPACQVALTARLDPSITDQDKQTWSTGTVEDWANEAHGQAIDVAYGKLPSSRAEDLQGAYSSAAAPVVEMQLKRPAFGSPPS
jgi:hypothetical protein